MLQKKGPANRMDHVRRRTKTCVERHAFHGPVQSCPDTAHKSYLDISLSQPACMSQDGSLVSPGLRPPRSSHRLQCLGSSMPRRIPARPPLFPHARTIIIRSKTMCKARSNTGGCRVQIMQMSGSLGAKRFPSSVGTRVLYSIGFREDSSQQRLPAGPTDPHKILQGLFFLLGTLIPPGRVPSGPPLAAAAASRLRRSLATTVRIACSKISSTPTISRELHSM